MRTIIAGSRSLGLAEVNQAMECCGWTPTVVLSGTARGVDRAGEEWAAKYDIPIERYPADWKVRGKSAGFIRNMAMARAADALVAVWDGESPGTKHMIWAAESLGLRVFVWIDKDHQC